MSTNSTALIKAPTKKQLDAFLDRIFRERSQELATAFFDKLLERIKQGDPVAMQQFERVYKLSQQGPQVAVQINNNNTVNAGGKSRDRRFEGIIDILEKRDATKGNVRQSDVVDAEWQDVDSKA